MSLLEKVKNLELELSIAREQIDRISTSKLDEMLHVQKSVSDKTSLGFVYNGSSTIVNPPKFVPATSSFVIHQTFSDVKIQKVVAPITRRTRVDLSEFEPKSLINLETRKTTNHSGFVTFVVKLGIQDQIALSCKL